VDIRIGVTYSAKELDVELPDDADRDQLKASLEAALTAGSVLWVLDNKGREVGVPADKVAYVELGRPDASHRVGFSS